MVKKQLGAFCVSGTFDFIIQRLSAIVLAVYLLVGVIYWVQHPAIDFTAWQLLFAPLWMKIFTFLAFLSLVLHAWVGMWTVITDYIHRSLQGLVSILMAVILLACLGWSILILWGF